jgi:hypothetical protein
MVAWSLDPDGTDPDGDALEWSTTTAPEGLGIDPVTGSLSWTPTERQGPGDHPVTVRVEDPDGAAAERSLTIHVTEVNRDPSLDPIDDRTVRPGGSVSFTPSASDPDRPANALVFTLVTGPEGATVDPGDGAFAFTAPAAEGDHEVTIGVSDGAGGSAERTFTIHVVRPGTSIRLGGDTEGQTSDRASITATLRSGGDPVPGASVTIELGSASQTLTTDDEGRASASFPLDGRARTLDVKAVFEGTSGLRSSTDTGTLRVRREDASIIYAGDTVTSPGTSVRLAATFLDSAASDYRGAGRETGGDATVGDVTRARIRFAVWPAATCLTGAPAVTLLVWVTDGPVTGDGVGTAAVDWTDATEGTWCILPSLVGDPSTESNGWYTAPDALPAGLAVFSDTTGKVTGGGWVPLDSGRANFGLTASSKNGNAKGSLVFLRRVTYRGEKATLVVKSNAIESLRATGTSLPVTATLSGKATIRFISAGTGDTLFESGKATFTATLTDTGGKGADGDAFGIRVTDKNGDVVVDLAPVVLGGGNIVAHLK